MSFNKIGAGKRTLAQSGRSIALTGGQIYMIPSGQWLVNLGPYTFLQYWDPVTHVWMIGQEPNLSAPFPISSDGSNYRLINLTGTVVGAVITNAGSGYTDGIYYPAGYEIPGSHASLQLGTAAAPSVTFASGSGLTLALGNVIVGGCVAAPPTIVDGGSGYTRVPTLVFDDPPAGGVRASAVCLISGGAISVVSMVNQGAGYITPPNVTVIPDPEDDTGTGAQITTALAGSGGVTAITMAYNGSRMSTVPAISFSPATTTAATSIMCFTSTAVTSAGATNLANGSVVQLLSGRTAGTPTRINPAISTDMFRPRPGFCAPATAAGAQTIVDGGLHQTAVQPIMTNNSNGTISAATTFSTNTVGFTSDTSYLIPW